MAAIPRTARGTATKERLLRAAEAVFADLGYHDASIVKITEAAGVAMGTFYLYFSSKLEIFEDLVADLNRRVRQAMQAASADAPDRLAAERAGFRAFFAFTAEHPGLYRVIRQAEFVSPRAMRAHYERIIGGYADGLRGAVDRGEIAPVDPDVAAWALMGMGELIGLRWLLWNTDDGAPVHMPEDVLAHTLDLVERVLSPGRNPALPAPASEAEDTRIDHLDVIQEDA